MAENGAPEPLIGERLMEVLALIAEADSVELKATVPDSGRRSAVTALGMDPLQATIRQVWFFDTPSLDLEAAGVVVRARRSQGRPDDSAVKLRPVVPAEMPAAVRSSPNFVTEVDVLPGGFVCSGALRARDREDRVRQAVTGLRPISSLFTREQRDLFAQYAPAGIELDALTPLGPVNVLKLKFTPEGYSGRLVAELWHYPDGSRILEISTKCLPADALRTALETRAFLESQGVDISGVQQTKTRTALELFSREAAAGA